MKKSCVGAILVLGLGLTVMLAGAVYAGLKPYVPVRCTVEPVSYDPSTGRVVLDVAVGWHSSYDPSTALSIDTGCGDLVTVRVVKTDGLTYNGAEEWQVLVHPGDSPVSTHIEIVVPPSDTSGITLTTGCGRFRFRWPRYFITSGDSITAVWSDPRIIDSNGPPLPDSVVHRMIAEDMQRQLAEQQAKPAPSPFKITTGHYLLPGDSAFYNTLTDKGKREFSRMRMLERKPLEGAARQIYMVDDYYYGRDEGEKEFHRLETYTREDFPARIARHHDSVMTNPPDNRYELFVDLRKPDDYEFLRAHADSLLPTDSAGIYRAIVDRQTTELVKERGIPSREGRHPR